VRRVSWFSHLLFLICATCRWSLENREFLQNRSSPLEFYLHRSQFIRLLLSGPPGPAIAYANDNLRGFYPEHTAEFQRLMTSVIYLPKDRLQRSPYFDLALDSVHTDLEPLFAKEYCASLGMSRQVPLRVICDIGGGGALARIEKARTVMKERKSEWSQTDELPVRTFLIYMQPELILSADRNSSGARESLSFHFCLSSIQGAIHGEKSSDEVDMWTCHNEG